MIMKTAVKKALVKYGIPFHFPVNAKTGETITCTCYGDLYSRDGSTEALRLAILADNECPFIISKIPANYLASLRLIEK